MNHPTLAAAFAAAAVLAAAPAIAQSAAPSTAPPSADPPPDLFVRALAHPAGDQLYAFDFADRAGGDKPTFTRGHIDPSRPKGERVTIYEAAGPGYDVPAAKKRYERNASGDIWCDRLSYGADGPVAEKASTDGTRLFAFTPVPKPGAKAGERDLYKRLAAEMSVDPSTGRIRVFSAHLTKAWKPVFVARIDSVELRGACAPAPNGRPFTAELTTVMRGDILGVGQTQDVTRTITNLTPVG